MTEMENTARWPLSCQVVKIILLLTGALHKVQGRLDITDLDCFNDYLTEMFCSWRVPDPSISCSHDFQLEYIKSHSVRPSHCVPENIAVDNVVLHTECICYIKADFFVAADEYQIQIKSHGISIANTTIIPALKVKPKAPVNVSIEHNGETAIVHWDNCYTHDDYLFQKLNYDVYITSKQDPTEVKGSTLDYLDSRYIIRKRLLRRGHDYSVKIRSVPNNKYFYDGVWSEWSPEGQWHNDYDLSAYEIYQVMKLGIGPATFICISLCFVCIVVWKKKWWNNIPDPGKSHLAMTMLYTSRVPELKSNLHSNILPFENKRKNKKTFCGRWLKKLISRNQDNTDKKSEIHKSTGYLNSMNHAAVKNVFIPEVTAVERSISLTPLVVDTDLENKANNSEGDHEVQPLECDFITRMFFEILKADNKQEVNES